ncbi:MAG TPA: acyl carrier protein [Bacteroidetes bacterium]|nr:acyl carrier protein [Bacteroidota bacterium]
MTDNQNPIKEKVKSYILQSVHAEKEKIQNETLVFKEGYFDSMGFITMISFLEEEFNIRTGDEDLIEENFESINAITGFVSRKLNNS